MVEYHNLAKEMLDTLKVAYDGSDELRLINKTSLTTGMNIFLLTKVNHLLIPLIYSIVWLMI